MERNKKKKKKKESKEREKGKGKERKGERGKSASFFPGSLAFRQSELIGPRSKVSLLDEGYTSRSRNSSYFGYFYPKGYLALFSTIWGCLAGFLAYDKAALF